MSKRRSPFETSSESMPVVAAPPDLYESLRVAEPRKRNRHWEKQRQSHKAVYRGIDPRLSLQVKSIAGELCVPEGEVARAIIEHALRCYERGELDLNPRPNPYRLRMTLFPNHDPMPATARSKGAKHKPEALWRVITTWRGFPPELKTELSALASEEGLHVPVGELISALLRFGLKEYQQGRLTLTPVPKRTSFTLSLEGTK
ncbi:MAG: hypothetical protein KPEEDBHJ_00214 [Anaerolineales bacterium]|nr:hypothetical protein [Anaerolineales bacterium]HAX70975.1 hypothetical protein [Anaerolineae bacterium]HRJ54936.1 hypothetical protein [Anaerolineales bacterium]HRK89059.1 hypothetical protein [Anaerolineales bacterium]